MPVLPGAAMPKASAALPRCCGEQGFLSVLGLVLLSGVDELAPAASLGPASAATTVAPVTAVLVMAKILGLDALGEPEPERSDSLPAKVPLNDSGAGEVGKTGVWLVAVALVLSGAATPVATGTLLGLGLWCCLDGVGLAACSAVITLRKSVGACGAPVAYAAELAGVPVASSGLIGLPGTNGAATAGRRVALSVALAGVAAAEALGERCWPPAGLPALRNLSGPGKRSAACA